MIILIGICEADEGMCQLVQQKAEVSVCVSQVKLRHARPLFSARSDHTLTKASSGEALDLCSGFSKRKAIEIDVVLPLRGASPKNPRLA